MLRLNRGQLRVSSEEVSCSCTQVNNVTSDLLAEVLDSIVSSGGNLVSISGVSVSEAVL